MSAKVLVSTLIASACLLGCANRQPDGQPAVQSSVQAAPVPVSTVAKDGKFAKLSLGMSIKDVYAAIGMPDDSDSHESGKRWIPFYFGNDARRFEALYKNEGCLVFAGGNIFGGNAEGELKQIQADPSGGCFRH